MCTVQHGKSINDEHLFLLIFSRVTRVCLSLSRKHFTHLLLPSFPSKDFIPSKDFTPNRLQIGAVPEKWKATLPLLLRLTAVGWCHGVASPHLSLTSLFIPLSCPSTQHSTVIPLSLTIPSPKIWCSASILFTCLLSLDIDLLSFHFNLWYISTHTHTCIPPYFPPPPRHTQLCPWTWL